MYINLKTKATTTPVSTTQMRSWLRTDAEEDTFIRRLLLSATNRFEKYTGRTLSLTTYEVYYDSIDLINRFNRDIIRTPHRPISSITSISYFDSDDAEQSMTVDVDYHFITGDHEIRIDKDFSPTSIRDHRSLKMVYIAGFSVYPDDIIRSLEMYTTFLYEHRGDEEISMPNQIAEIWDPYQVHIFGGSV